MMIRPVFDPAVPAEVREALLSGRPSRRPAGQLGAAAVRAVALGVVCALLPVAFVFTRMFGRAGRVAAAVLQAGVLAAWLAGGLWVGIVVTGALQLAATVGAFLAMDAWYLRRGARRARGRYLTGDDFDPEARDVLGRAQAAIAAVTGSAVAAEGLLDQVANELILSRQEWEIALALRAGEPGAAMAVRRVEALERYADRVREADVVWSARLANPRDAAALAEIDDLADEAQRLAEAIRADPGDR